MKLISIGVTQKMLLETLNKAMRFVSYDEGKHNSNKAWQDPHILKHFRNGRGEVINLSRRVFWRRVLARKSAKIGG